jgi:hypothetical protein
MLHTFYEEPRSTQFFSIRKKQFSSFYYFNDREKEIVKEREREGERESEREKKSGSVRERE